VEPVVEFTGSLLSVAKRGARSHNNGRAARHAGPGREAFLVTARRKGKKRKKNTQKKKGKNMRLFFPFFFFFFFFFC
jgi:hypothetical protein